MLIVQNKQNVLFLINSTIKSHYYYSEVIIYYLEFQIFSGKKNYFNQIIWILYLKIKIILLFLIEMNIYFIMVKKVI